MAALVTVLPGLTHANSQGTILGHITDPSGAALDGATATITNVATSVASATKTSSVGDYVFVNVIPGNYDIVIEAIGFKQARAERVRLDVEATLRQSFQLQIGGPKEKVTVSTTRRWCRPTTRPRER
jgi:hypothetical protein